MSAKEDNEENENNSNDEEDNDDPINKEYNSLKREKFEKENKIQKLESEYKEKITELLILAQIHCEIKTDMHIKLNEAGVINSF